VNEAYGGHPEADLGIVGIILRIIAIIADPIPNEAAWLDPSRHHNEFAPRMKGRK
jgi:hypothetical protein